MGRRIVDVDSDALPGVGAPCAGCLFWESTDAPQGPRRRSQRDQEDLSSRKAAWWRATQLEWGMPGKLLTVDEDPVAFAAVGPALHYPRIRRLRVAPSEDALLLAALWVDPDHRGRGYGKFLLHAVLRETARRRSMALEAYGARGVADLGQTCFIPESFLLATGFEVHHEDPVHPLLRLDLRKTVRWQESFGHALEGFRSAFGRRERARAPARPALEVQRH